LSRRVSPIRQHARNCVNSSCRPHIRRKLAAVTLTGTLLHISISTQNLLQLMFQGAAGRTGIIINSTKHTLAVTQICMSQNCSKNLISWYSCMSLVRNLSSISNQGSSLD
jgi:hypothetical protein